MYEITHTCGHTRTIVTSGYLQPETIRFLNCSKCDMCCAAKAIADKLMGDPGSRYADPYRTLDEDFTPREITIILQRANAIVHPLTPST
jgi:hypothetical protein